MRSRLARVFEQGKQFARNGGRFEVTVSRFAPAEARPVVRAHARDLRDVRLHPSPSRRHPGCGRFEHDGRRALADAVEMQLMAADVDEPAGMWELPPFE